MRGEHALYVRDRIATWSNVSFMVLDRKLPWMFADLVEAAQWWGPSTLRSWQAGRLRAVLTHARDRSPFYRSRVSASLVAAIGDDPSALRELPELTKDEVREHGEALVTRKREGLLCINTSGTTGVPVRVWRDAESISFIRAVQQRAFGWHGADPKLPVVHIGGTPSDMRAKVKRWAVDRLIARRCLPAYDVTNDGLDRMIEVVAKRQPRILSGYSSALCMLAQRAIETDAPLSSAGIRLVMPISEVTTDTGRQLLSRAFGAPTLIEYGCVEIGAMAYSCPAGNLHPSHEHVLFEVVDDEGRPSMPGEAGRVLLTTLMFKEMPLIRYQIGDRAIVGEGDCPCGRYPGSPWLSEIAGRTFDRMLLADGRAWHAISIYYAFKHVFDPQVFREFQGIQRERGKLEIVIVPGPRFTPEAGAAFVRAIRDKVRGPLDVTWSTTPAIARERSGKFKYFRSLVVEGASSDQPPGAASIEASP